MKALLARQAAPKVRPDPGKTGNPPPSRPARAKRRLLSAAQYYPREKPGKSLNTKLPASSTGKSSAQRASVAENRQGRDGSGMGRWGVGGDKIIIFGSTPCKGRAYSCMIG